MSRFPYFGAPLSLNVAPDSGRGPSGRKPAGFRRRTGTGGADGARCHASAAAACSEEHHVWYIDESTRRPCFDIREHIVIIIECADRLGAGAGCNRSTRWVWCGLPGDGGYLDGFESTRGSPRAVLDRELPCSHEEMEYGHFIDSPVLLPASECRCTMPYESAFAFVTFERSPGSRRFFIRCVQLVQRTLTARALHPQRLITQSRTKQKPDILYYPRLKPSVLRSRPFIPVIA